MMLAFRLNIVACAIAQYFLQFAECEQYIPQEHTQFKEFHGLQWIHLTCSCSVHRIGRRQRIKLWREMYEVIHTRRANH